MSDLEQDFPSSGKAFNVVVAVVAGLALLAGVIVLAAGGLSASERKALDETREALVEADSRPGPLPTPQAVERWDGYRKDLGRVKTQVEEYYSARDRNLEKFFPEFDPRSGGDRYRMVHRQKAMALYERAAPVLLKDSSGVPAPMKEVFAFPEWPYIPGDEEVRIAQKEFNLLETTVDLLLDLKEASQAAGAGRLAPALMNVAFEKAGEAPEGAVAVPVTAAVQLLLDARDVPALLAGFLGPGKHGLLTRLSSVSVKKTGTLELAYKETVKAGEEPRLKPDGFLKPVNVTLTVEVLDYLPSLK